MTRVPPSSGIDSRLTWRKSSYSNDQGGNCVEVASGSEETVPVRDSKDMAGPVLTFTLGAWQSFVAGVRAGEFEIRR